MSALSANCPSCGAPIVFKSGSSIVVICSYCRSAVARTDRALADLGRVAELMETGSPLQLGLRGKWRDVPFELTGHAQMGHEAGGVWDEWYATFANGWVGWLAEAQGRFYLTFRQEVDPRTIPPFERLELGIPLRQITAPAHLGVVEKGRAQTLGAAGEIPYQLVPGEHFYYADLSGAGGAFGTVDYSETHPAVFVGHEVSLADLGLTSARAPERKAREVKAVSLSCPNCAGPLELRAPDQSERVTCPNCNGLLDVNEGQLSYLRSLGKQKFNPYIPIGSVGQFEGASLTLIGFMVRSVEIEGTRYFWGEYLLYHPQVGFRWLVHSDNHWSFVQAVPPGEVIEGRKTRFRGKTYKIFQDAATRVEHVAGEFYWRVEVGESVWATDYVRPPLMLSKEITKTKSTGGIETGEINWSLGHYVSYKEVERTFKVDLPRPSGVAPNQPFRHKGVYAYWGILVVLLLMMGFVSVVFAGSNAVMARSFQLPALPNPQATQVVFSEQFEIVGRRNVMVEATSNVNNSWMFIAGDLVNDDSGLVQTFDLPIEYYHGVDGGESWSEGGTTKRAFLSALPEGRYTLRLEAQWGDKWQQPANVNIKIEQGAPRGFNFLFAFIGLSVIPVLVGLWHWSFERKRWSESMFGGGSEDE